MKKLLLASAVAALSVTAAQAAPTVYGKAFLSLDHEKDGRVNLNSTSSRIGFKGAEKLTANTEVVYQLEYGVKIDDTSANFNSRDTYLGLAHKQYGTVLAGHLTAIDGMVDYANVTAGGVIGEDKVQASFDAPRAKNTIAYVSPSYNGLQFLGMYSLNEDGDAVSGGDTFGVGGKYEPNGAPYKAGATYIQAGDKKVLRVSGKYELNKATTVGALFQHEKDLENVVTLSAEHKYGQTPWTAYGQLDLVDHEGGSNAQRLVVGGKYGFNKAATGHVYAGVTDGKDVDARYGVGAGLEYKF